MEEWVDEWFTDRNVTLLNVYVLGLILVEHFHKSNNIPSDNIPNNNIPNNNIPIDNITSDNIPSDNIPSDTPKSVVQIATQFIVDTLCLQKRIDVDHANILNYMMKEESETLEGVGKMLFECSKNPQWLQSQFRTVPAGKKILLARPADKNKFSFGTIKTKSFQRNDQD